MADAPLVRYGRCACCERRLCGFTQPHWSHAIPCTVHTVVEWGEVALFPCDQYALVEDEQGWHILSPNVQQGGQRLHRPSPRAGEQRG